MNLPTRKKVSTTMLVAAALGLACASTPAKPEGSPPTMSQASNPHIGRVRHVVLFKFKDSARPEDIRAIEAAFAALPAQIPEIRDYEWGTDMSPEGLAQGHTHCFLVTFDTAAARDAYLPHPAHKAFVDKLLPLLDRATVVDFVAKSGT